MQAAPEADGAEGLPLGQRGVGKIDEQLIGSQVNVIEGDDVGDGLLENLRAPAGFAAGVEALADGEAEFFPKADESGEIAARGAIGVVVVIGPAEAEAILAGFLTLGSAVFALPVFALGGEENVAGAIDADFGNRSVEKAIGPGKASFVVGETAISAAEGFLMAKDCRGLVIGPGRNIKTGVSMAFNDDQLGFIVVKYFRAANGSEGRAFDGFMGALNRRRIRLSGRCEGGRLR